MAKRRAKYVEPPMRFNPALQKFEPALPTRPVAPAPAPPTEGPRILWAILIGIIVLAAALGGLVFFSSYFINECRFKGHDNYTALRDTCDRVITNHPSNGHLYFVRGITNIHLADYEAAKSDFTNALALGYVHESVFIERGLAEAFLHENAAATQDFTRAIWLNTSGPDAYQLRCFAKTQSHDFDGAMDDCNHAILLDPGYAPAYYSRGALEDLLNDTDAAIRDFSQSLELSPNDTHAYMGKGNALRHDGRYADAIAAYDQAMQHGQNDSLIHDLRGIAYLHWGNDAAAVDEFTQAILVNQTRAAIEQQSPYVNRAIPRIHLGDLQGGIEDSNTAIALNWTDPNPYDNRALAELRLGQLDLAKQDLLKSFELDEHQHDVFVRRCARNESISSQEAIDDCDKLLLLDANDTLAKQWRNTALQKLNLTD